MQEATTIPTKEAYARLEHDAATLLGYMLFEYSRLDMELGLLLVWTGGGRDMDALTKKLATDNFNARLELLARATQAGCADNPEASAAYGAWIVEANRIRHLRNHLFHGRWGFIAARQSVACIVGLPTSPDQQETSYSIGDLEDILESMKALRSRLGELRTRLPL